MRTVGYWMVVASLSMGLSGLAGGADAMSFEGKDGQWLDVLCGGQPVARYMIAYDPSTSQRRFETYKPFLHVYDGEQCLTNGPDGQSAYIKGQIRYPHHRGIYIGWNKLNCEGKRYDLWHMPNVAQVHQRFEQKRAEGKVATIVSVVHWNDPEGKPLIVERRTMTIRALDAPAIAQVDFQSELKAVRADVQLKGDPEHAGVQYRPHNDVATGSADVKAKYLFHADGIDPREDKDLPWVAMSYGLGGKRYTVQHVNHPANPKGTVYSAYRDYGRFGAFFEDEIENGQTLTLRYRLRIARGEMPSREALAAQYAAFAK